MKKAIIVASFGCSMIPVIHQYIRPIENAIQTTFPDIPCFRAFTSEMIRKKLLRTQDLAIDNLAMSLKKRREEGFTHIYIVSVHVIPGFEYEKLVHTMEDFKGEFEEIKLSRPLLDEKMGELEAQAILDYVGYTPDQKTAALLIGHGSEHRAQEYYTQIAALLQKENPHIHLAHIDGAPFLQDTMVHLKKQAYEKIHLYPFMIVAGDHAINDITSDEPGSIHQRLQAEGFEVDPHLTGFGSSQKIQEIFQQRTAEIVD